MAKTVKARIASCEAKVLVITPEGDVETRLFNIPPCRSDKAALDFVRKAHPDFSPARVVERGVVYTTYEADIDDFMKIARKTEG